MFCRTLCPNSISLPVLTLGSDVGFLLPSSLHAGTELALHLGTAWISSVSLRGSQVSQQHRGGLQKTISVSCGHRQNDRIEEEGTAFI